MKRKLGVVFADTKEELNSKMIGFFHDHCYHIYTGKTKDISDKYEYKDLIIDNKEYCFIYEEDIPYKKT